MGTRRTRSRAPAGSGADANHWKVSHGLEARRCRQLAYHPQPVSRRLTRDSRARRTLRSHRRDLIFMAKAPKADSSPRTPATGRATAGKVLVPLVLLAALAGRFAAA